MEVKSAHTAALFGAAGAPTEKRAKARGAGAKEAAKEEAAESAKGADTRETSGGGSFKSVNELTDDLRGAYGIVRNGQAAISARHLRACLTDEEKRRTLFENLAAADAAAKNAAQSRKGLQSFRVRIDEDGEMTMESSRRTVGFNAAKRARQIAAAKCADDIKTVLGLLSEDLAQCEDGLRDGACDEAEVEKVKAMIREAERRMAELSGAEASPGDEAAFAVSLLI